MKAPGLIRGLIGMTIAVPLAGAAINAVGSIGSGMSSGVKGTTQSMIGVGLLSHGTKLFIK